MSRSCVGAVIASPDGWFSGWRSQLAPQHDCDDTTCVTVPSFHADPEFAQVYETARAAIKAAKRIEWCSLERIAVVELTEVV